MYSQIPYQKFLSYCNNHLRYSFEIRESIFFIASAVLIDLFSEQKLPTAVSNLASSNQQKLINTFAQEPTQYEYYFVVTKNQGVRNQSLKTIITTMFCTVQNYCTAMCIMVVRYWLITLLRNF